MQEILKAKKDHLTHCKFVMSDTRWSNLKGVETILFYAGFPGFHDKGVK